MWVYRNAYGYLALHSLRMCVLRSSEALRWLEHFSDGHCGFRKDTVKNINNRIPSKGTLWFLYTSLYQVLLDKIHQRTHKKELHQIPLYLIILPAPRFSSQDTQLCSRSRPFFSLRRVWGIEEKLNYELLESARCTFPKKTASIPSCSTPSSANDSRASSYQSPACEDACDRGEGDEP